MSTYNWYKMCHKFSRAHNRSNITALQHSITDCITMLSTYIVTKNNKIILCMNYMWHSHGHNVEHNGLLCSTAQIIIGKTEHNTQGFTACFGENIL